MPIEFRVGTAGWSIPKPYADAFAGEGTHLERYARQFSAVEINSSFYRPHMPSTYARWAARYPRTSASPSSCRARYLTSFGSWARPPRSNASWRIGSLGDKLGPVLVQLPPSLRHDQDAATSFLRHSEDALTASRLRAQACKLVHRRHRRTTQALPGGARRRRSGPGASRCSPRRAGPASFIDACTVRRKSTTRPIARTMSVGPPSRLRQEAAATRANWCIFDNTALGEQPRTLSS